MAGQAPRQAALPAGFEAQIFTAGRTSFSRYALDLFYYQYQHNPVYRAYAEALPHFILPVTRVEEIPFLPIGFFKTHEVKTGNFGAALVFESSGTTGSVPSRHYVKDWPLYRNSFMKGFGHFYGPVTDWCIIGLLPSYLERAHSSLIAMVDELIKTSGHPDSGFYLHQQEALFRKLQKLEEEKQQTLLIGVSFALMDFAEKFSLSLRHTVVMETGGMKGRRREMPRAELHDLLKSRLGLHAVHSEYGMTELLSQAYSKSEGIFEAVPWMKVLVRKDDDPFDVQATGEGIINVIDLANIHSCAFIATDDAGIVSGQGTFEVLGRTDGSDLRGCSLLLADH